MRGLLSIGVVQEKNFKDFHPETMQNSNKTLPLSPLAVLKSSSSQLIQYSKSILRVLKRGKGLTAMGNRSKKVRAGSPSAVT